MDKFRQINIPKEFILMCLSLLFFLSSCNIGKPEWQYVFNGEDLYGWVHVGDEAVFEVADNYIIGKPALNSGKNFLRTEHGYGDFILEFEFKADSMVRSGVLIRSGNFDNIHENITGYSIEIDPSARSWTGGIHGKSQIGWLYTLDGHDQKPARNAFVRNEWNKIRIEAVGHRIKTWLNGIPVANIFCEELNEGKLALQGPAFSNDSYSGSIMWRNIRIIINNPEKYVIETSAPEVSYLINQLTEKEVEDGWRLLFNGENSDGWRRACQDQFPGNGWTIENGTLTAEAVQRGERRGGDIITNERFSNFELRLQAKLVPGANSGIKYFVNEIRTGDRCSAIGPEYQLIDDSHPTIRDDQKYGSLYDLKPPENVLANPIGEWDNIIIKIDGSHVEHWLNGYKIVEYDRQSDDFDYWVQRSKFNVFQDYGKTDGHILLQYYGDEVSFRSIKIRTF